MRAIVILLAALSLSLAQAAAPPSKPSSAPTKGEHQRYKWKDADGNLHYDDVLPEAAERAGYDIVNKNGMLIKHVDAAKSPEQMKADREAAAKKAAEQHAAEEQAKHEQQLLAAYPTEQDLMRVQKGQLDSLDQETHAIQLSLDSQEKSLSEMLNHAAELERTGKPVTDVLKKQIDKQRATVEKQKDYIAKKRIERETQAQRFADDLEHYRALRAKTQDKPQP
jgi:hypothetical protein